MPKEFAVIDRDSKVTLREVTPDNLEAIIALEVSNEQRDFVAANTKSIEQAQTHQEAWLRAIYAGETPVGSVMLRDENLKDEVTQNDYYFLWRLMIDKRYQNLGFGRRAMELLIEHIKRRPNATTLLSSFRDGPGSPEGFYAKLGFERTGNELDGEVEIRLRL
jgi:diamine N-acetyltransferase